MRLGRMAVSVLAGTAAALLSFVLLASCAAMTLSEFSGALPSLSLLAAFVLSVWLGIRCSYLIGSRRLPRESTCQNCGYNLIGNVSGVCPECGERI